MIEYKIVTGVNTDDLENKVADLIDLGFQPCGGVAVTDFGNKMVWGQGMVRAGEPTTLEPVTVGDKVGIDIEEE